MRLVDQICVVFDVDGGWMWHSGSIKRDQCTNCAERDGMNQWEPSDGARMDLYLFLRVTSHVHLLYFGQSLCQTGQI